MPKPKTKTRSIFGVHPGVAMVVNWVATLKEKSGRTVEQWIVLGKKQGLKDEKALRDWFKKEHGLGTNSASWLAERTFGKGGEDDSPEAYMKAAERYVREMFEGKGNLKPLYEALVDEGAAIADDVKACPCKTMVPLYRNHVFAQIKPTTKTRIDLGFALGKFTGKIPARLIDTGGKAKGDRITHRIPMSEPNEIDDDVRHWLRVAYDLDA
jgi:uncharacterized protein DUF5655